MGEECVRSVVASPGEVPDFASSPEVLTWTWMLRGEGEVRVARPASSWEAFFIVSTEETRKRFGI